jgi:hypothetical protein
VEVAAATSDSLDTKLQQLGSSGWLNTERTTWPQRVGFLKIRFDMQPAGQITTHMLGIDQSYWSIQMVLLRENNVTAFRMNSGNGTTVSTRKRGILT